MFLNAFKGISEQKAIGLGAFTAAQLEALFSPLFWLVAILCFAILLATGRLTNGALRVIFFWIPTVLSVVLGFGVLILILTLYLWLRHVAPP